VALAGGKAPERLDGVSFLDVLVGRAKACREDLFATHSGDGTMNIFPERSVRDLRYDYILNLHPDREWTTHFTKVEGIPNSHAEVWDTWIDKARNDATAARLVNIIVHHPAEELYDTRTDPYELTNLVQRVEMKPVLEYLRQRLAQWQKQVNDQAE
jgi:N-sulfoglucosamine sulfohydrolase